MRYHCIPTKTAKIKNSNNASKVPIWDISVYWEFLKGWEEMRVSEERIEEYKEPRKLDTLGVMKRVQDSKGNWKVDKT